MPGIGTRLLLVEDQDLMAMTIASVLARLNYNLVGSAATAERAVELARQLQPDVILMDFNLKGAGDGVDTARAIRGCCDARIIFLTGADDPESVQRMHSVNPSAILHKPFRRMELASRLAEAAKGPQDALV